MRTLKEAELKSELIRVEQELRKSQEGHELLRTTLKETEERLKESEKRFHLFMDNSPATAFIKDEQGRYVYFNKTIEKRGLTSQDVIGKTTIELFPGDRAEQLHASDMALLASDKPQETQVTFSSHVDGSPRHYITYTFPYQDCSGRRFLGGMSLEITERKQLEDRLRQSQKMEAIGQLAGGVAHDFNNLLTVIVTPAQMVCAHMAESDPRRKWMEMIIQAGTTATKLVSQLLAFSRKQIINPKVLNLNDLVQRTEMMLRRIIGEQVKVVVRADKNIGGILADAGQIEQVLINLAVNARDAMPDGGTLTIETMDVTLSPEYAKDHAEVTAGEYVLMTVTDTGTGIPKEIQPHIFEPFFTTKKIGDGTGLGLATCFGIVKQAQGHLTFYSEPGQGTTFKVYLPKVEQKSEKLPQFTKAKALPRGVETVLLVEDEPLVRELAATVLREHGYTVVEASEGNEALRVLEDYKDQMIHMLITDLVMPGMSGRQLAQRTKELRPEIGVIFTSGYTADSVFRNGLGESEIDFIMKPLSAEALTVKAREVLNRRIERSLLPTLRQD